MESVRILPPAGTSPSAANRSSSVSSTTWSRPPAATLVRNSLRIEASKPGSSRSRPSAYFQSIRVCTASATCRSVRSSAFWKIVTRARRLGGQPGLPRTPQAPANCSSASHSPSWSRTITASGRSRLPRYIAATAATISGAGCGHGCGWTDITNSILRPGHGRSRPQPDHAELKIQNGCATPGGSRSPTELTSRVTRGLKTRLASRPGRSKYPVWSGTAQARRHPAGRANSARQARISA